MSLDVIAPVMHFAVLFIRRRSSKWELSQRMFASGSAAPSATTGDVHIAHSLAGRVRMDGCAPPPAGKEDGKEGGAAKEEQVRRQIRRPDQQKSNKKRRDEVEVKKRSRGEEPLVPVLHPSESCAAQMVAWR